MRISSNITSIIAGNCLNSNNLSLAASTERLSSGYKINSAADDAAGMAISIKMRAQLKALQQADDNANDGISVVNTADGAMSEMHDILQRLNELSIQAANGTNSDSDREQIQLEVDELVEEIDRIADTTQFNAQNLLDGSFAYKGYTNTENIKVMSYSDDVTNGVYAISGLTYYYDESTIESANGTTTHQKSYSVDSVDDVRNALVTTASDGIKAFPDDCIVSLDEDEITITGEGDFEVRLALNNNDPVDSDDTVGTTVSTTTYTTDTYGNVVATNTDGEAITISELNVITNKDGTKTCTASIDDEDIEVTDCTYNNDGTISITTKNADGTTETYSVTDSLDGYLESHAETTRTAYAIGGSGDNILLDLTGMGAMRLQVGANEGQVIEVEIPALQAVYLGIDGLDVSTQDSATAAIDKVSNAIDQLSGIRAKIGAYSNRLEHTITNLDTTQEEMTAAYSRIMDTDMAEEMTNYTTIQVLVQSSTSMLAQANEDSQSVLQLLQ